MDRLKWSFCSLKGNVLTRKAKVDLGLLLFHLAINTAVASSVSG